MTAWPLAARCFSALLQVRARPPAGVDLVRIAMTWPPALASRLLVALPAETMVASFMAIPSLHGATRVAQLLRSAGLDRATDDTTFEHLMALHRSNPARALTLRRAMEWEARDSALWPAVKNWPEDPAERTSQVAMMAESTWASLPMPCVHRLPRPDDYPDAWTAPRAPLPELELAQSWKECSLDPLRSAIEWLHLWRLDAPSADAIRSALPTGHFDSWIAALAAATDPRADEPLQRDLVLLEHLVEQHEGTLSLLEIDSLLKGVSDPEEDENLYSYDGAGRKVIQDAINSWLEKAGVAPHP
jgi:hypothetical protein